MKRMKRMNLSISTMASSPARHSAARPRSRVRVSRACICLSAAWTQPRPYCMSRFVWASISGMPNSLRLTAISASRPCKVIF